MQRKNFSFRFEWQQAIAYLNPEERLEVYEETIRYARTGRASFYSARAEAAFNTHILPDFERRAKAAAYRARRKARIQAEAANKSATPTPPATPKVPNPPTPPIAPISPNRRERRLMEAEQKRLDKKRKRNALARSMKPTEKNTDELLL